MYFDDASRMRHVLIRPNPDSAFASGLPSCFAAWVMHAVQTMQAMEDMLQRQRSRANQAEGAAW
jgi:organic hydroperoxide reductase OsmC/OhrA